MNRSRMRLGLCALSASVLIVPSFAQTKDELINAHSHYMQEVADCKSDDFAGDVAACVKEARNSFAEFKRGRMNEAVQPSEFEKNALLRCEVHQGDDKTACIARIRGEGRTEGSVSGGGILRELVTVITTPNQ